MRRMLPQKLIDYIKELKNSNIYIDSEGFLNVEGGISLNGEAFNEIGNGLAIDNNVLGVEKDPDGGLEVGNAGLKVKLAQDGGLSFDEDGAIQSSGGSSSAVAYEGTSLLPTDVVMDSWGLHRAIKDGNILWIVISGLIKNNGSASASITNMYSITLPSEISSHIYRLDGVSCDNATAGGNTRVAYTMINVDEQDKFFEIRCTTPNVLTLYQSSSVSINAGGSKFFGVRFPLFLDIGSNE